MYEYIVENFREELKKNLFAAIKFGTEGEPNNLLFVLNKIDFEVLEQIKGLMNKYGKKLPVVPLFFTKYELKEGSDVFPLEFLDIKQPHELLYGIDVVNQIKFEKRHVRIQLEFEIRSKLIHLRENYIWIKTKEDLRDLLISAVPSLMPLFYGLLFLKDAKAPTELNALFGMIAEHYKINVQILKKIKSLRNKKIKANDNELRKYVKDLMLFLKELVEIVDKMSI